MLFSHIVHSLHSGEIADRMLILDRMQVSSNPAGDNSSPTGKTRPRPPPRTKEVNIWLHPMWNTYPMQKQQSKSISCTASTSACGEGSRGGLPGRFEGTSKATSATGKVVEKEVDSSWEMREMPTKNDESS